MDHDSPSYRRFVCTIAGSIIASAPAIIEALQAAERMAACTPAGNAMAPELVKRFRKNAADFRAAIAKIGAGDE
jgi:hypothetical protein